MGDARRTDLRVLCNINGVVAKLTDEQAAALRDAIGEIEAARAAPASVVVPGSFAYVFLEAVRRMGAGLVSALQSMREAGPSRAERLVRYRCAALTGLTASPMLTVQSEAEERSLAEGVERFAHAMLAAEREPQS